MNYVTNYYKNLSEQLQRKVDILTRNLYENLTLPPQGGQNLIQPQQPQGPLSQKIPIDQNVIAKASGPELGEPRWFFKLINPYSAGDWYDQQRFNSILSYLTANFNNLTEGQRTKLLVLMMSYSPGNMNGQQFLNSFPSNIQSYITSNFNAIYTLYANTYDTGL